MNTSAAKNSKQVSAKRVAFAGNVAHVLWTASDRGELSTRAGLLTDSLSPPVEIARASMGLSLDGDVAGNAFAVGQRLDSGDVFGLHYVDGAWHAPALVAPGVTVRLGPEVLVTGDGGAVVVWGQMEPDGTSIQASVYR